MAEFYTFKAADGARPYGVCKTCHNARSYENKRRRDHGSGASNGLSALQPPEEPDLVDPAAGLETVDGRDRPDPPAPPEFAAELSPVDIDLDEHAARNAETVRRLAADLARLDQGAPAPPVDPQPDPSPLRLLQPDDAQRTPWSCSHSMDMGAKRCVNCCHPKPEHYVLRAAGGGSPAAWRYLCGPCFQDYQARGRILTTGVPSGGIRA